MYKKHILALSGPSNSGKTTIIKKYTKNYLNVLKVILKKQIV